MSHTLSALELSISRQPHPIKFLRAREVVHFQRFGEALQSIQEELDAKNFYAFTPGFDNPCTASCNSNK